MFPPDAESSEGGVPPSLHSTQTNAPFTHCIDCGGELLGSWIPYAIEKIFRQGEVVFEYAICAPCVGTIAMEYSAESLENIREYLAGSPLDEGSEIDRILRAFGQATEDGLAPDEQPEAEDDPDRCHRCGASEIGFAEERTVAALLIGDRLATDVSALCGACTEGIEAVLSEKTRDVQGDFIVRNFPGVPAGLDLPVGVLGARHPGEDPSPDNVDAEGEVVPPPRDEERAELTRVRSSRKEAATKVAVIRAAEEAPVVAAVEAGAADVPR